MIAIFTSCDSGVEIENIPMEQLYSVSAFISPQDTLFRAYVFYGKAIGELDNPEIAVVENAEVIITDGLNADTLKFNTELDRYEGKKRNVDVRALNKYFLKITLPEGRELHSSCIIPPAPELPLVEGEISNDDYLFEVSWNNPSRFQYFVLMPFGEGYYELNTPAGSRKEQVTARLLDDVRFPSNEQLSFNSYEGIVGKAGVAEKPTLTIYLRNVSKELYEYFHTYNAYLEWDANNDGSMFPNLRQPQPVFSNIENGVGIFGGYNQVTVRNEIIK
jgi:hypothetical protein